MAELKQYRCDVPGCSSLTEFPLMVNIRYARTEEELNDLKKMAASQGKEFTHVDAIATSIVEQNFDFCKTHYDEMKAKYFTPATPVTDAPTVA